MNKIHTVHGLKPYETHFVWVDGNNNGECVTLPPARQKVVCTDNFNGAPPFATPHTHTPLTSLSQFVSPSSTSPSPFPSPPPTPAGKMHRMREATYFLDPPAYYSQPGAGRSVVVSAGGAQGGSQGGTKGGSFPSNR